MSIYTSSLSIAVRSFARRIGIAKHIQSLINAKKSYEEEFDDALLSAIGENDCAWDVGANVGKYTQKFSRLVGVSGRVIAFEPSPDNYAKLEENCGFLENVTLRAEALGDESGFVSFVQGEDAIGATSHVAMAAGVGSETQVRVERGDALIEEAAVPIPNVIKIDTEGFEVEVIRGLGSLLAHPELRAIGVEVHFGILARRGMKRGAAEVESRLKQAGFATRWVDLSHVIASR